MDSQAASSGGSARTSATSTRQGGGSAATKQATQKKRKTRGAASSNPFAPLATVDEEDKEAEDTATGGSDSDEGGDSRRDTKTADANAGAGDDSSRGGKSKKSKKATKRTQQKRNGNTGAKGSAKAAGNEQLDGDAGAGAAAQDGTAKPDATTAAAADDARGETEGTGAGETAGDDDGGNGADAPGSDDAGTTNTGGQATDNNGGEAANGEGQGDSNNATGSNDAGKTAAGGQASDGGDAEGGGSTNTGERAGGGNAGDSGDDERDPGRADGGGGERGTGAPQEKRPEPWPGGSLRAAGVQLDVPSLNSIRCGQLTGDAVSYLQQRWLLLDEDHKQLVADLSGDGVPEVVCIAPNVAVSWCEDIYGGRTGWPPYDPRILTADVVIAAVHIGPKVTADAGGHYTTAVAVRKAAGTYEVGVYDPLGNKKAVTTTKDAMCKILSRIFEAAGMKWTRSGRLRVMQGPRQADSESCGVYHGLAVREVVDHLRSTSRQDLSSVFNCLADVKEEEDHLRQDEILHLVDCIVQASTKHAVRGDKVMVVDDVNGAGYVFHWGTVTDTDATRGAEVMYADPGSNRHEYHKTVVLAEWLDQGRRRGKADDSGSTAAARSQ
jgi:hypothetical protein